jgi:hypothetical protein
MALHFTRATPPADLAVLGLADSHAIGRFWRKVDPGRVDDACWQWRGGTYGTGHGYLTLRGKHVGAHRVAWMLGHGRAVPAGKAVCHTCDTPGCVNPAHLFVGTHRQNMADMVDKNRQSQGAAHAARLPAHNRSGERNGRAKLTADDVRAIRARGGEPIAALAREYRVSWAAVYFVRTRRHWPHI